MVKKIEAEKKLIAEKGNMPMPKITRFEARAIFIEKFHMNFIDDYMTRWNLHPPTSELQVQMLSIQNPNLANLIIEYGSP